jgi:hypothetical protein
VAPIAPPTGVFLADSGDVLAEHDDGQVGRHRLIEGTVDRWTKVRFRVAMIAPSGC